MMQLFQRPTLSVLLLLLRVPALKTTDPWSSQLQQDVQETPDGEELGVRRRPGPVQVPEQIAVVSITGNGKFSQKSTAGRDKSHGTPHAEKNETHGEKSDPMPVEKHSALHEKKNDAPVEGNASAAEGPLDTEVVIENKVSFAETVRKKYGTAERWLKKAKRAARTALAGLSPQENNTPAIVMFAIGVAGMVGVLFCTISNRLPRPTRHTNATEDSSDSDHALPLRVTQKNVLDSEAFRPRRERRSVVQKGLLAPSGHSSARARSSSPQPPRYGKQPGMASGMQRSITSGPALKKGLGTTNDDPDSSASSD